MKRAAAAWLVVGAAAVSAWGDRVFLNNGRIIEGKATESEGKVLIEMDYGAVSYPASEVARIERMPTGGEVLDWRLGQIDRSNPDDLFEVAEWARDNDLPRKSEEMLREVLALKPDHARARKLLGYVRADGKWRDVPEALQLATSKLAAGKHDELLNDLLPGIAEVAGNPKDKLALKDIESHCRLRCRQFDLALQGFELLAEKAPLPDSVRYAAVVKILRAHPDGMYVVTEAPLIASRFGAGAPNVRNGPGSLADANVLASGLRDEAKAAMAAARAFMDEGRKLEHTDPEAAGAKYALAARRFDRADAIVPDIARSFRVEIARRRIAMITRDMAGQAQVFDGLKEKLGGVSPAAYENHVLHMLRVLNHIRADLEAVLALAAPFEAELILEITDARGQLRRINALREILMKERQQIKERERREP